MTAPRQPNRPVTQRDADILYSRSYFLVLFGFLMILAGSVTIVGIFWLAAFLFSLLGRLAEKMASQ